MSKIEPTEPSVLGKHAFTGNGVVILLFGPNGPTTYTFHNTRLINFDISPFENGRLDQRHQSGHIEDLAKWEINGVSVNQDVGRGELWNDWNAVRDEREINEISLV